ncbi:MULTISPECIES: benzylsuccinate synthase gamma subunit family protein [Desulfatibacillum]|jgi:benzylsuccinate synthase|uniref:Benzylsuccinate synthase n=2 Tax=Desulfatibacillum TaxID=218207 RepID=A0A1M6CVY2_9BACT|nr:MULTISPECIES: benzylsuccinate synthase gamma subunit family protein [Desulfatibacillum]ACL03427.1 Alkylsuccinate synthase (I), putative gamma subunit (AssC1) [Desulfatibacillum aliphaticivorans]SHI65001.1 benzylsuccinate synthase [Desulfatibacillum alkenivorans DSM 16219]
MSTCAECRSFFLREDEPGQGDCVRRVVDPRQAFYQSKPVREDNDASGCESFQKK